MMASKATGTGNKGRILVVDDDRLVLATVVHGLSKAGYDVIDADNGDDAILLARQYQPEMALLDIRMHGKTGFDVAEYLRDVAHVPFMFLSAFTDDETRAKVEALGAVAYLVKPLEVGQIVPTVDQAFASLHQIDARPQVRSGDTAQTLSDRSAVASPPTPIVSVATGILMHRYSLTRESALRRLDNQAAEKGLSRDEQASRIVDAVEELAGPGT